MVQQIDSHVDTVPRGQERSKSRHPYVCDRTGDALVVLVLFDSVLIVPFIATSAVALPIGQRPSRD